MAQTPQVYVAGLRETIRAVRQAGDGLEREMRREFQSQVAPTVGDIRGRFSALGRTGPRTARTVRGSFTQNRIEMVMGGRGGPKWGFELGTEFGAKGRKTSTFLQRRPTGTVEVTRTVDYSKVFGPWTGNQFTTEGRVSGNAFYPGIRDHYDELIDNLIGVVEGTMDKIARAA